jgi:hypothetical protein
VQLGKVTEEFHINWLAKRQSDRVSFVNAHGELRIHDLANPWRYVTVDGWDTDNEVPIEVKHSNSNANIRASADYYMAQLQHNLAVTQAEWLWFSVIPGNEEPMTVKVERDQEYIARLTELERQFWWHVTEDVEPEIIPLAEIENVNGAGRSDPGRRLPEPDPRHDDAQPMGRARHRVHRPQAEGRALQAGQQGAQSPGAGRLRRCLRPRAHRHPQQEGPADPSLREGVSMDAHIERQPEWHPAQVRLLIRVIEKMQTYAQKLATADGHPDR